MSGWVYGILAMFSFLIYVIFTQMCSFNKWYVYLLSAFCVYVLNCPLLCKKPSQTVAWNKKNHLFFLLIVKFRQGLSGATCLFVPYYGLAWRVRVVWNHLSNLTHLAVNAGYLFGSHVGLWAGTLVSGFSIWLLGFLMVWWLE